MVERTSKSASRSESSQSPGRYAHPFFTPLPPDRRKPIHGDSRMVDWSKKHLGRVPPVKRHGLMNLAEVIGEAGLKEIEKVGEIRFHALGDSGVGMAHEAEEVAGEMATDFKVGSDGLNPAFLLHLGDIIYGPDKETHYGDRFYRPYRHYPGKILAIPGNHDGEVRSTKDSPSLSAFLENFCAKKAAVPAAASGIGVYRETMTQPGVYWMLDAPYVRIIGLYSNLIENPGYLEGSGGDSGQIDWLAKTLKRIASDKNHKALIIATHHPPYSQSGHSGSTEMNQTITDACTAAGVLPDAVLSAHAHNYQRYTRRINGRQILYIVAGGGGMPPQHVADASGQPADSHKEVTYDAALKSLGYLFVTVSATHLKTEFWPQGQENTPFDPVAVNLTNHTIA